MLRGPAVAAAGAACLGLAAGFLLVTNPTLALAIPLAVGAVSVEPHLRSVPPATRCLLLGILLGCGQLAGQAVGQRLLPLLVLLGLIWARPPLARSSHALTFAWSAGATALIVGVALTFEGGGRVPMGMVLTLAALATAALFAHGQPSVGAPDSPPPVLLLLIAAGTTTSVLVLISALIGQPLVETSSNILQNSRIGDSTRASGPFTAPNEAGIVVSAGALAIAFAFARGFRGFPWLAASLTVMLIALAAIGSRSSILSLAVATLVVAVPRIARRPGQGVVLALAVAAGLFFLSRAPTFSGRGLNVLTSSDASSEYRRAARADLLDRVDWAAERGYGFSSGNLLADNPVAHGITNIDHAWLYLVLSLGAWALVGISLLAASSAAASIMRSPAIGISAVTWLVVVSLAENLFVLPSPAVAAFLLLGVGALLPTKPPRPPKMHSPQRVRFIPR